MDDIPSLRAELKAWERDFKTEHGREPSVDDIKARPSIASRYKQYKKLTKIATAVPTVAKSTYQATAPPPVSSGERTSHLPSKARAVHTIAPPTSSNPFSPTKDKGKQKAIFTQLATAPNPFATPTKKRPVRTRTASPDPFAPNISQPSSASSSSRLFFPPVSSSPPPEEDVVPAPEATLIDRAVLRARKRLRGEPVSPSPNKDKRRRTSAIERALSQTTLSKPIFASAAAKTMSAMLPDSDPDDAGSDEAEHVFLPDSPVKGQPANFKLLFDEPSVPTVPVPGLAKRRTTSGAVTEVGSARFKRGRSADTSDEEPASTISRVGSSHRPGAPSKTKRAIPGARQAALDTLSGYKADGGTIERREGDTIGGRQPAFSPPEPTISNDHAFSEPLPEPLARLPLLPPSPPPADTRTSKHKYKSASISKSRSDTKGKGKAPSKKRRVSDDEDDAMDDGEDGDDASSGGEPVNVRVYDWGATRRSARDAESDFDPEFDFALSRVPLRVNPPLEEGGTEEENFEVDLPSHLHRILSLSPLRAARMVEGEVGRRVRSGRSKRDAEEEALARAVVSGTRAGHYDPSHGGEIWDIGEVSEGGEELDELGLVKKSEARGIIDEDDDDWEGEGVPWEAGEL